MNPLKLTIIYLCFFSCSAPKRQITIISENPIDFEKLVEIPLDSLGGEGGKYPIFLANDGQDTLTSQLLKEEATDQQKVLLAVTFNKELEKSLDYVWVDKADYPTFEPRTNIRIGYAENKDKNYLSLQSHVRPQGHKQGNYIYQAEGPIWESDMVAFRTYFDKRNGKDIFGKTTNKIITEEIGVSGNYHKLQNWGMDILKVNNSLGAGALAMLKDGNLYRLGETERAKMEILRTGILSSQLLLDYDGWNVLDNNYNVDEKISISAGNRYYESEILLDGGSDADTLVTGIVDLHELPAKIFEHKGYHVLYSHGAQSYIEDMLGMAVIISDENFAGFSAAPKEGKGVSYTHTAYLKPTNNFYKYSFYVGWEKEDVGFKGEKFFVEQIKAAIDIMSTEVAVNYNR